MAAGLALGATAAAVILDAALARTRQGSVTTEAPGYVYACATVMKVWLAGSLVGLLGWGKAAAFPSYGAISLLMGPMALPASALLAVAGLREIAVLALMGILATGGLVGVLGLARREGFWAGLGVGLHSGALGLCWYLQFSVAGFDQDAWAPRAF
jgi:hypothetical protein